MKKTALILATEYMETNGESKSRDPHSRPWAVNSCAESLGDGAEQTEK